jgi:hypothetical protein
MKPRQLPISISKENEYRISAEGYPSTFVRVGVYPTDTSELYIITKNGTWISVDLSGRIRMDIPPKDEVE